MVPALRAILVGRDSNRFQRNLDFLFAAALLVATFAAYAVALFQVTGGVIVLPQDATLVGFVAAAGIGHRRGGSLSLGFSRSRHTSDSGPTGHSWGFRVTRLVGSSHSSSIRSGWPCSRSLLSLSGHSASPSGIYSSGFGEFSEGLAQRETNTNDCSTGVESSRGGRTGISGPLGPATAPRWA